MASDQVNSIVGGERTTGWRTGDPGLPGVTDYHHVHAHYIQDREIFATWDKGILRLPDELHASFGVRVMKPAEALGVANSIA